MNGNPVSLAGMFAFVLMMAVNLKEGKYQNWHPCPVHWLH